MEREYEQLRERCRELLETIRRAPVTSAFDNAGKGPHRALGGADAIENAAEGARQALLDLDSAERKRF